MTRRLALLRHATSGWWILSWNMWNMSTALARAIVTPEREQPVRSAKTKFDNAATNETSKVSIGRHNSRLLLYCALPRKVALGETNRPSRKRYRGQH